MYSRVSLGNKDDYTALGGGEEKATATGWEGRPEHVCVICGISTYHLIDTSPPRLPIGAGLSSTSLPGPRCP